MTQQEAQTLIKAPKNAQMPTPTEATEVLLNNLTSKIAELEQRLAFQTTELAALKQYSNNSHTKKSDSPSIPPATSRRKLLKKLGVTAAGVVAGIGAIAVETPSLARAADGDYTLLGNSNIASNTTYLSQVGGASPTDKAILWLDWNQTATSSASPVNAALVATAAATGTELGGVGGYFRGNLAPIMLQPALTVGAPTTGNHYKGELFVDSNGDLFICQVGTGSGAGTWVKVNGGGGGGGGGGGASSDIDATNNSGASLAIGTFVNLYNNTGTLTMRKADWSAANDYIGSGVLLATTANATIGNVRLQGSASIFSGLTVGTVYYGDPANAGGYTATLPTTSGQKLQFLMLALSATTAIINSWSYRIKRA